VPGPTFRSARAAINRAQRVRGALPDRHGDGDRHAPFPGGTVGGPHQRGHGLVEVGVGHDHHVVLRPAEGLNAFALRGGGAVDGLVDRGGANEADRLHLLVGEHVDGDLVAVHDVEHPVRQAGLGEQPGKFDTEGGVLLGRLHHERVPAGEGDGEHPHRDHGGEVERGDPGDDAERLAEGDPVDGSADILGELTLQLTSSTCTTIR